MWTPWSQTVKELTLKTFNGNNLKEKNTMIIIQRNCTRKNKTQQFASFNA